MHKIKLSQAKAISLINSKGLFADPNGAHPRNMAMRRIYNKAVEAGEKSFEVELSNSELTHFRNGIVGGILRKESTDREAGFLMACADSLHISSWVEGLIPKMEEAAECKLPLDADEDQTLDETTEGQEE